MVNLGFLEEYDHRHAHKRKKRGQLADIKRNQLTGDRGADIRAHDDPHCLPQRHHTGVDKADDHDGRGGGGLNGGSDARADQHSEKTICREFFQDPLHPVAGRGLKTGAHHLHAVQEQRQTAQESKDNAHIHNIPSVFPAAPQISPLPRSHPGTGCAPPLPYLYTFFSYPFSISNFKRKRQRTLRELYKYFSRL